MLELVMSGVIMVCGSDGRGREDKNGRISLGGGDGRGVGLVCSFMLCGICFL